ncbi:polyketide cyclase [Nocardiopsis gilva YIM 90087]|uniref:Polyketide cyclase n=2 Tax=Nocardiopsis gilva TaxID=280236 RepID=A0A223SDQ7_9ACTN|nr:polyketide cyclase [Nocardiopsis gilva YIM 90087]
MAQTSIHDLYRRWIDDVWNGSPEAVKDLVGDDFVGHWPDQDVHGPTELAERIGRTQAMFTDLRFELQVGPFVEENLVAGRWTGRGRTSDGEMSFFGNDILLVRDGRFVEYWVASSAGS